MEPPEFPRHDETADDVDWAAMSAEKLKDAWAEEYSQHGKQTPSPTNRQWATRWSNIMTYIEADKIWPPTATKHSLFAPALCEVMSRLPADVFSFAEDCITFVLEEEDSPRFALNIDGRNIPVFNPVDYRDEDEATDADPRNATDALKRSGDVIVIFHTAWTLEHKALVGLIAHEIAHSFVEGRNYAEDERLVDDLAASWGFEEEVRAIDRHSRKPPKPD